MTDNNPLQFSEKNERSHERTIRILGLTLV